MLKRELTNKIKYLLNSTPKSVGVLGPRQCGKTTLLKSLEPDLTVQLADEAVYQRHLKDPGLLRAEIEANPKSKLIFIGEIQRLPSMLNSIQALIDESTHMQFLITGSSARKLKRVQSNLLPGRVFWLNLNPLTMTEISSGFDLERAISYGMLPEVYLNDYGPELLKAYTQTYLKEEIQAEAFVKKLDSFARFLDLAAVESGNIINYSKLSSDSEIPKETLRRYFDLLEDTLMVHRIKGFSGKLKKRRATQKEKFIFFDIGVRNAILVQHKYSQLTKEWGHLFEQLIWLNIIALNPLLEKPWRYSYYRDDSMNEVDIILERDDECLAIEIKSSSSFKESMTKNLDRFAAELKDNSIKIHKLIVYTGPKKQQRDDVQVVPFQDFLEDFKMDSINLR